MNRIILCSSFFLRFECCLSVLLIYYRCRLLPIIPLAGYSSLFSCHVHPLIIVIIIAVIAVIAAFVQLLRFITFFVNASSASNSARQPPQPPQPAQSPNHLYCGNRGNGSLPSCQLPTAN